MHDPYAVLGLSRGATSQQVCATFLLYMYLLSDARLLVFSVLQVKQAYKKLALRWHPDLLPVHERTQAEATFKDISAAYAKITQGVKLRTHNDCAASRMQVSCFLQERT